MAPVMLRSPSAWRAHHRSSSSGAEMQDVQDATNGPDQAITRAAEPCGHLPHSVLYSMAAFVRAEQVVPACNKGEGRDIH